MKALIIDDTEMLRNMYQRHLEHGGFEVVSASDGSQALEAAKVNQPDVILMDVMMPGMNGIDAIKVLKADEETKHIPVIILTAYEDDSLLSQFTQSGAARFIVKSNLEFEEIITIINQVVTSSRQA